MRQNPRTRKTVGLLALVAGSMITMATMVAPASAVAAPVARPATSSAASSDITAASQTDIAETSGTCTSHWKWSVSYNILDIGGSSKVEWTSNSCGYKIQERSWCSLGDGSGNWETSGVVVSTGLWDGSSCPAYEFITRGEVRFDHGSGWGTYKTFWSR